jgi:hypothetical protein
MRASRVLVPAALISGNLAGFPLAADVQLDDPSAVYAKAACFVTDLCLKRVFINAADQPNLVHGMYRNDMIRHRLSFPCRS